jgi:hypothetical protein
MLPPKNISKIFFNFKIPGKIPKINFSKFEDLMLKNCKFLGVFLPLKIFPRKNKKFQIFPSFKMFPKKNVSKITFFSFKIPGKISKIYFSGFGNLSLKNSKFKGVFLLLQFSKEKLKFSNFF